MKYFNLLFVILLLFTGCNRNRRSNYFDESRYKVKVDNVEPQLVELNNNLPTPFHFKEIKRVETPLGGYPRWIKTPRENELILFYLNGEKGGHGVLFYDNELNLTKRKVIRKGAGPGEADGPLIIGSEDKIYLFDIRERLTTFDYNFNILEEKRFKREGVIWGIGLSLIKNNTEILHYADIWKEKLRHGNKKKAHWSYAMRTMNVNDCSINVLRSEDIMNDTKRRWMRGTGVHWIVHNDFIYFVNLKDYIISKMDFNGKVLKKIKIKHKEKEFSQEQLDEWYIAQRGASYVKSWSFPKKLWPASFIIKIKEGFAIGRREDYSPQEQEYVIADYFTWNMEFKGKIKLPLLGNYNNSLSLFEPRIYYKEPYFYTIKQEEEADFIIKWEIINGD